MNNQQNYDLMAEQLDRDGLDIKTVKEQLKEQVIELPSWAVGNSGTRYGTVTNVSGQFNQRGDNDVAFFCFFQFINIFSKTGHHFGDVIRFAGFTD